MAAGPVRDDVALIAGLDRWLAPRGQKVARLRRPSSGWTNETVMVDVTAPDATLVVRLPPIVASFPDQDVAFEAAVLRTLASSSLPTPDVVAVVPDESWLGAPFVVMSFVDGHVLGDIAAFDEWLATRSADSQRALHESYLGALGALHTFDWRGATLDAPLPVRMGLADELAYWQRYVEWAADGAPTRRLADALQWCCGSAPTDEPGSWSLLWGDARLGNVIFADDASVAALIDWEGASVGPPEMDLGWYLALDALATHFVGRTVPGFLDRDGAIASYERALGRAVAHLEWHEVFALVRSTAINECQARLATRFGIRYPGVAGDDNPVLDYVWDRINRLSATR